MLHTKSYTVHVIPKTPACGEYGVSLKVYARNASEARAEAQREVWRHGYFDRHDGPLAICACQEQ